MRNIVTGTLPTKYRNIQKGKNFKKEIKHTPHIFFNTQHCCQHYIGRNLSHLSTGLSNFSCLYEYKECCWHIEIVKFRLVVHERKTLKTSLSEEHIVSSFRVQAGGSRILQNSVACLPDHTVSIP
jgi:hypothetical protein